MSLALYKYVLLIDQFLPSLEDIENYEKNISSRRNYSRLVREIKTGLTAFREDMMSLVKVMFFDPRISKGFGLVNSLCFVATISVFKFDNKSTGAISKPFSAWCPLKGHAYLKKYAAFNCSLKVCV